MAYTIALFAHIAGVGLLFAGDAVDYVVVMRMRRAATLDDLRQLAPASRMAVPFHATSAVLILLAGLYMAATRWGWTRGWIDVAIVLFVVAAILGSRVFGGRFREIAGAIRRAEEAGERDMAVPDEVAALVRDPKLVLWLHTLGVWLFGFIYLMTAKPGWTGSIVAMAVATAVGYVLGLLALRREGRSAGA